MRLPFTCISLCCALSVACSQDENRQKKNADAEGGINPRLLKFECDLKDEMSSILVERAVPWAKVLCERAQAERKILGLSNRSAFKINHEDIPAIPFSQALWVGEPIKSDEKSKDALRARGKEVYPLPSRQKLHGMLWEIQNRFASRCPSAFAGKKTWIRYQVKWEELNVNGASGHMSPIYGWFGYRDEYSLLSAEDSKRGSIELASTGADGENLFETWLDKEKIRPEDYKKVEERQSWILRPYNKTTNYSDGTLAHEMGHYFFDQWTWQQGRLNVTTGYFSEVIANWVASLCYFSHLEDKEVTEKTIAYKDSLRIIDKEHWPLDRLDFEIGALKINDERGAHEYYVKGLGLGALYASLVLEDRAKSDELMQATLQVLEKMQGRKLRCRPVDRECAGTDGYFGVSWPLEKKPHTFTLSEFLERFEAELEPLGGIPAKAQGMWKRYKAVMAQLEQ